MSGRQFSLVLGVSGLVIGLVSAASRWLWPDSVSLKTVQDLLTISMVLIGAAAIIEAQVRRLPTWVVVVAILFVCFGIPAILTILFH